MALATQVYPIVSSTEKELAQAEARQFANYASVEANPDSCLVRAVLDEGYQEHDEEGELREFATGKVARPPMYVRFSRWIRKRLRIRRDVYGYDRPQDGSEAVELLRDINSPKKSTFAMIRDWVNNGAAVMILVTMVLLALLLIVYYFKSGTTSTTPGRNDSHDHE